MRTLIAPLFAALLAGPALAACPPDGTTREQLTTLKSADWKLADDARRQTLALGLLGCLADPDPQLRDDIAFEALARWMRAEQLSPATVQAIRSALLTRLAASDSSGFAQPFAALTLAEVARVDRLHPFLSAAERAELVAAGSAYLAGVRDYRGFEPQAGWRHGVAHGADLMLQLSLNPALGKDAHEAILAAIASQVAPPGHFYQYGEGERLMAPLFYLSRRAVLTQPEWDAWFARLLAQFDPRQPTTQAQLAQRHNLRAFLLPLYASLADSGNEAQRRELLPLVRRSLKLLD